MIFAGIQFFLGIGEVFGIIIVVFVVIKLFKKFLFPEL